MTPVPFVPKAICHSLVAAATAAFLVATVLGCATPMQHRPPQNFTGPHGHPPEEQVLVHGHPQEQRPVGRELDKVSLPDYVIEPPDVLTVEALRVVPKAPYRVRPLDALQIDVAGTSLERPIRGTYIVEPGGYINLGPGYPKVKVAGLSLDEARDAVQLKLEQTLVAPQVSLTLAESAGVQQITGLHTVGPDGYINLGTYGTVYVTGLTVPEATAAIEQHLTEYLEDPKVAVDVFTYGSKVYYVITEGAGLGDNIQRIPITGNETVLDALAQINGRSPRSSTNIWIARPAPGAAGCYQVLPVKWDDITKGAGTATNYQIMPGDRVFIEEDHWIAANTMLEKITAPFERVLGFSLLGAQTVQVFQRFPGGLQGRF